MKSKDMERGKKEMRAILRLKKGGVGLRQTEAANLLYFFSLHFTDWFLISLRTVFSCCFFFELERWFYRIYIFLFNLIIDILFYWEILQFLLLYFSNPLIFSSFTISLSCFFFVSLWSILSIILVFFSLIFFFLWFSPFSFVLFFLVCILFFLFFVFPFSFFLLCFYCFFHFWD